MTGLIFLFSLGLTSFPVFLGAYFFFGNELPLNPGKRKLRSVDPITKSWGYYLNVTTTSHVVYTKVACVVTNDVIIPENEPVEVPISYVLPIS